MRPEIEELIADNPELGPALTALEALDRDQRMAAFSAYCRHCGGEDPMCQCWNDE